MTGTVYKSLDNIGTHVKMGHNNLPMKGGFHYKQ